MKYLLITGASRGIGRKTAELFLKHGWHVINFSRSPLELQNVTHYEVDLSSQVWGKTILPDLKTRISTAHQLCLVHNAARHASDTIESVDEEEFRKTIEVNLLAPLILNKALIPMMPSGSSILYIGSTLSEKAVPNAASYVISKHAVIGMMRATCQDLAGRKIHTACICPGFTETEMLRSHCQNDDKKMESFKAMTAYHRLIAPEEISDLVWYCANQPILNGAVIHANLGQIER